MQISDLIKKLEEIKDKNGDIEVKYQSVSHIFDVYPVVKETISGEKCVLMNP